MDDLTPRQQALADLWDEHLRHEFETQDASATLDTMVDDAYVNRRVFAEMPRGAPDGLAVDEDGRVWVAAFGGGCATCFAPDGRVERVLEVPATNVASLCFGGADRRDLYVATADNREDPARGGSVFRVRVERPGLAVPLARV